MMDLSVEAEAFGAPVQFRTTKFHRPGALVCRQGGRPGAEWTPPVGARRTRRCIDAVGRAVKMIADRPVFAGVIGPFSLAGRMMGMTRP